jgi:membrane fusion protein (multidrug efflux system)
MEASIKVGRTHLVLALGALIILCLLDCVVTPAQVQARPGGGGGPVPVIVVSVVAKPLGDKIQALGTIRANETVVITADTAEKITALHFEEGQTVTEGDLLVTLDQRQELAQLRSAKAQLAESEAAYMRAQNLHKRSALSAATVQERLAEKTRNEVDVDVLEARLAELRITAPFSGVIGLRQVSIGALVQPGDLITTLDDLSQVKVDFQVPSRHLAVLKPGLKIEGAVAAFGDKLFQGEVVSLDTQIDPVTRTVKLRALILNREGLLRPGLLMKISLMHSQRNTLLIPEEAIIKRESENFVFRVDPGAPLRVSQQAVVLGARQAGQVEILSGLSAVDQVVIHGVNKLRPGAQIVVRAREQNDETLQELHPAAEK